MGVAEYWLFDPQGGLHPRGTLRLQGLTLTGKAYKLIPPRVERGAVLIRSKVLRLDVRREGELLRFRDMATGEDIRHHDEKATQAEQETARAEQEAALRQAAQVRVAELEAALRRAQAGSPSGDSKAQRGGLCVPG